MLQSFKKSARFLQNSNTRTLLNFWNSGFFILSLQCLLLNSWIATWESIFSWHSEKIPFPEAVSIMSDVAEGLANLHERNPPIVHRDLACKNILLTEAKQAKIADLGLAKVFPLSGRMHASPQPGTQVYAAPETFSPGDPVEYDVKIDIFSFGVVLMKVINGSPPVVEPESPITKDGERILEKKRREHDIKKMGEHKLKKIVLKCIEDSSEDRPSAEEVSKWLHNEWNKIRQKRRIAQVKVPKLEISVLGQFGVGKSCLITRFVDNEFDDKVISTIGQALCTTNIRYRGKKYCLQIEDTAGLEKFRSIIVASIKGCQGVVLVFDLTNRRSLYEGISEMEQLVKDHAPDSVSRILVGNKLDLVDAQQSKREISRGEAECFAQKRGIPYIETSAYSGKNVESAFELIAKEIYETLDLSDIDIYIGSTDNG